MSDKKIPKSPKTEPLPFTMDTRRAEEALMTTAQMFDPVEYLAEFGLPTTHLQNVLVLNTLTNAKFMDIVSLIGIGTAVELFWSTPHSCVTITPLGHHKPTQVKRIFFTRSKPTGGIDFEKFTWSDFMVCKEVRDLCPGMKVITVNDPSEHVPFNWKIQKSTFKSGDAFFTNKVAIDRLFIVSIKTALYTKAEIEAVSSLALGTKAVGECTLFAFSMLKYYIDHFVLNDQKNALFYDLYSNRMLSEEDRSKMFAAADAAAEAEDTAETDAKELSHAPVKVDALPPIAEELASTQ